MKPLSIHILFAVVCCLTSLLPASGADKPDVGRASLPPPKRIVVPKLHGPLSIDGSLDEAVWSKAAVLSPFVLNDGSGPEREKTAAAS